MNAFGIHSFVLQVVFISEACPEYLFESLREDFDDFPAIPPLA